MVDCLKKNSWSNSLPYNHSYLQWDFLSFPTKNGSLSLLESRLDLLLLTNSMQWKRHMSQETLHVSTHSLGMLPSHYENKPKLACWIMRDNWPSDSHCPSRQLVNHKTYEAILQESALKPTAIWLQMHKGAKLRSAKPGIDLQNYILPCQPTDS